MLRKISGKWFFTWQIRWRQNRKRLNSLIDRKPRKSQLNEKKIRLIEKSRKMPRKLRENPGK